MMQEPPRIQSPAPSPTAKVGDDATFAQQADTRSICHRAAAPTAAAAPAAVSPAAASPAAASPAAASPNAVGGSGSPPQRGGGDTLEAQVRRLAASQHGVVSRGQLLAIGMTQRQIDHRLASGRLQRIAPGIYRVGPVSGRLEREMAALLTCGETSVISHGSSMRRWEIPGAAGDDDIEVAISRGYRRPRRGLRVHRCTTYQQDETTLLDGLRITTPARTLLDMAARLSDHDLERAVAAAQRKRLATSLEIRTVLERHPRLAGAARLRRLLGIDPGFSRSQAEAHCLALIREAALPTPEMNVPIEGVEVDMLWRRERLVVELDGWTYHSSRDSFERDRRRDAILTAAGLRVVRFTWRQITRERLTVIARISQALARTWAE
jgi:very-short-patch-repair endonuclease